MVIRNAANSEWHHSVRRRIARLPAMATEFLVSINSVDVHQLATIIRNRIENVLIIDSRSFIEHNASHIATAVNVCCSKIVKRRLQQDKLSVKELLMHTCHCDVDEKMDVIVYDQCSKEASSLASDGFTIILLKKLQLAFRSVTLLSGGFEAFQENYPDLCEDKTRKCPPLTSLSQPCLPIANQGPTRILSFLYLGSQFDAMNKDLLKDHNINYQLNVSTACPQPEFVQEGHFMRIPVNDNYSEKLLPYFPEAFTFLDKVREGNGCVLVHCLAGISRSPTVAIAYVMRYLRLSSDDGYRYVKSKRPTISPNFNFLGQLLEYEKQLRKENILDAKPEVSSAPPLYSKKRLCRTDMRTSKLSLNIDSKAIENKNVFLQPRSGDQSPTTALAKLSFGAHSPTANEDGDKQIVPDFRQYRSKSCYGDWFRDREDSMVERKSRECNVASTTKVLSPVKEIKCDALISEISTGQENLKSSVLARQQIHLAHSGNEEKHLHSISHLSSTSSDTEEKFSVQTLSHFSLKSTTSLHTYSKINEQCNVIPSKLIASSRCNNDSETNKRSTVNKTCFPENGNKRACHMPLDRSADLFFKKEKVDTQFVFHEHSSQYKPSSLHHLFTFNSEAYKRSDSATTSGFGSEGSDIMENNEIGKKPSSLKLEIDIEDLEDDVILKNDKFQIEDISNERSRFSLTLPEAAGNYFQGLESPLSPSESHLVEDLEMDKEIASNKTESSRPSSPSEETDSFHDSGVPSSPPWVWPKKRPSTNNSFKISLIPPFSEKCNFGSNTESFITNFKTDKDLCFMNFNKNFTNEIGNNESRFSNYELVESDGKSGLYRVQSCPGILNDASSFSALHSQSNYKSSLENKIKEKHSHEELNCRAFDITYVKPQRKEVFCYESCPDVSHLGKIESCLDVVSHRQKDFRRYVRMIQVS